MGFPQGRAQPRVDEHPKLQFPGHFFAHPCRDVPLRSRLLQQLPWEKGCQTMRPGIPSRKGAVDDRGSRRRHETVAHFGHQRIGFIISKGTANLGPIRLATEASLTTLSRLPTRTRPEYVSITSPLGKGVPDHEVQHALQERSRG